MEKHRAIPQGYMTVGTLAKKMNTTVRALQYYDKEGLLSPTAESEGGRRLYTDKDVIRLHQILSMKYLGFSLGDIKTRLGTLETPEDVADALAEQAKSVQDKIASLSDVLHAIEKLRAETMQMQTVDFSKYADIVVNLQMKNDFYVLIKNFDNETLDRVRNRFDAESGAAMMNTVSRLFDEVSALQKKGVPPESEQGKAFAKAWWDMVMEFTDGDMSMLTGLIKVAGSRDSFKGDWQDKWTAAEGYIEKSLEAYFIGLGVNPFEEVEL